MSTPQEEFILFLSFKLLEISSRKVLLLHVDCAQDALDLTLNLNYPITIYCGNQIPRMVYKQQDLSEPYLETKAKVNSKAININLFLYLFYKNSFWGPAR